MKILIFGTGMFYQNRKRQIPPDIEIMAFLDNNVALHGSTMDSHPIFPPYKAKEIQYDRIILMSAQAGEMRKQLEEIGIARKNIWCWEYFLGKAYEGLFKICSGNPAPEEYHQRILVISTDLNYNGGTIAAVYAVKVLQEKGNFVVLAAPGGNESFIRETAAEGINIALCPALSWIQGEKEMFWIRQFDFVLVNVFQMAVCACRISRIRPTLWWIHEPVEIYETLPLDFFEYLARREMANINIYGVSNIAQHNFNDRNFSGKIKKIFPFGIPDQRRETDNRKKRKKLVFALIGVVSPRKAQDILIKAAGMLHMNEKVKTEFWLIGDVPENAYGRQVKEMAEKENNIKVLGQLERKGVYQAYGEIDVVVCPSLEETMSIVAVEGMMHGIPCIVSDRTGIMQYVEDGRNGLVCKTGSPTDLCTKIRWMTQNREKLATMGKAARQTYEQYFSMEKFGETLDAAVQDTIKQWRESGLKGKL